MHESTPASSSEVLAAAKTTQRRASDASNAAEGPVVAPVSASGTPAPGPLPRSGPSPADIGRRTLSTAFVRIGPGGHLAVTHHDGSVRVLRDVTMGPKQYCGMQVAGPSSGKRYCGAYADVAAARAVDAPL